MGAQRRQLWNDNLDLAISPCIDAGATGRICAETLAESHDKSASLR